MLALIALVFAPGRYTSTAGTERAELTLKPSGNYAYLSQGCFHREVSSGAYVVEGDSLALVPPAELYGGLVADRLRVVPWGASTFLVPEADLAGFAARVRGGWRGEDRDVGYLRTPLAKAIPGEPLLPPPWRAQIRQALDVRIGSVEGASLVLDAGTGEGLRAGTTLTGVVDGKDVLVVVRTPFAHESLAAWGTLDGAWPFPSILGAPLRLGTEKADIARFLAPTILEGNLIPKPEEPS